MEFWLIVAMRAVQTAWAVLCVAPLYVMVEVLLPQGRVSWRSRMQAAVFSLSAIPITAAVFVAFGTVWRRLGVRPLLSLDIAGWMSAAPPWLGLSVAAVLAAVVFDFFFYWMHRAQHRFFWRFHAVHHSIEELSAVSCYHHATEEAFRVLLFVIPMSLLLDVRTVHAPLIVATLVGHHTYWVHSATRLNWGPLRRVFDDNRFHRIHHSKDPAHFNKNFGGFSTIWDQIFRTAYFPRPDEWPDVGLADRPEPQSVAEYFAAPFTAPRRHSVRRGNPGSRNYRRSSRPTIFRPW